MLLFSWKKVKKHTQGKAVAIYLVVKHLLYYKEIPDSKYNDLFILSTKDYSGSDFLIHPERLFAEARNYSAKEVATYIGVAAHRKLADYKVFNKTTLDLELSPVSLQTLNENRLFRIEGNQIHFKFEEDIEEI